MIRATQRAVSQEANISLVNLRNIEINYFTSFFLNFGTQAATLAGAICGSLSQCPAITTDVPQHWKTIYFVGAAMVVALAIHLMCVTVFITVFGEGLALRGPEGSMVETIDGMVEEQRLITYIFVAMVFFFVVMQEVGMFFVMMYPFWAAFNSVFVVAGLLVTYQYARRIYFRFYWEKPITGWEDIDIKPEEDLRELNPNVLDSINNKKPFANIVGEKKESHPTLHINLLGKSYYKAQDADDTYLYKQLPYLGSIYRHRDDDGSSSATMNYGGPYANPYYNDVTKLLPDSSYIDISEVSRRQRQLLHQHQQQQTLRVPGATAPVSSGTGSSINMSMNDIVVGENALTSSAIAGYITMKIRQPFVRGGVGAGAVAGGLGLALGTVMGSKLQTSRWIRRFLVLKDKLIYYYHDRPAYLSDPAEPIHRRPIDLEGYSLVAGAVVAQPPYSITLVPIDDADIRKAWKFRCDTWSEFQDWIAVFSLALRSNPSAVVTTGGGADAGGGGGGDSSTMPTVSLLSSQQQQQQQQQQHVMATSGSIDNIASTGSTFIRIPESVVARHL